MKNKFVLAKDTQKKVTGVAIVCTLVASAIISSAVFAVQLDNLSESAFYEPTRIECDLTLVETWDDLVGPLANIGLRFDPDQAMRTLIALSPDVPINLADETKVDVLLTLARVALEYNTVFGWDECVTFALEKSGYFNYWMQGWRELVRPGRQQQIIQLAGDYSFVELFEMVFQNRPCMLLEFHALGFFLDFSLEDVHAANSVNRIHR